MHTTSKKHILQKACTFITQSDEIPTLEEVAAKVDLSPSHFHRLFTQALGITPRNFADAKRQQRFKTSLKSGDSITDALYAAGYGSSSRLYEFTDRYLGMTPRAYKQGGKDQTIRISMVLCPLGHLLIATTEKGICSVRIGDNKKVLREKLAREFPAAKVIKADAKCNQWTQALVDYLAGKTPWPLLPYDVQATAFQRKVWEWLRTIPSGQTYHYSEAAKAIGAPQAVRAVARACATNPVALVIPCHRIVPKSGGVGGYRWDPKRKKKLLKLEKSMER